MLRSICLLVRWHISIPPVRSKIWRERSYWRFAFAPYSIFVFDIHGLAVARSSVHHTPFSALFASAHEARKHAPITRAPKALLFFLSARSSTPGHLFTRMHSLLVDFARDSFAHRPIDWLACVYALTNCSAFLQAFVDCFADFRTCAIASSRSFRLRHQTKKRRLNEIE